VLNRRSTGSELSAVLAFWASAAENNGRPADTVVAIETLVTRDPEAPTR
jgi:hypothetical protein